ncbi:sensor histidine kinase [Desulfuromonas versatilis]|uniref:histidine kinase n=1 Tax=Desulfuromonas versatilis TaxID=2802975 RepID=A0ABM8HUF5_9BACT|nr:HAMP domain-containing sensor histidine kinase [Desulfuromonas versatilis]BCR04108.1 sensor histidine kinase [Desulfuromonas versatilis]
MDTARTEETRFAPPHRADACTIKRQADYFREDFITKHLLDAVPNILMILNRQRQIIYTNRALVELVGSGDEAMIHGLRPGEVLGCHETGEAPAGCGTGEACNTCGAVLAILAGLSGQRDVRECCITRTVDGRTESLNLRVWVTPLEFEEEKFCIFAVSDITHEKRRRTLERIFFHDILNVAGSIRGFAELLRDYDPADKQGIFNLIHATAGRVIDEIEAQRTITAAENHELHLDPELLDAKMALVKTAELFRHHEVAKDRRLLVDPESEHVMFTSDETLVGRVIGNMIKNALEASSPGETVTLWCGRSSTGVEFRVHNPAAMPPEAQLQVFRRSFSTKGPGRGLGTYSMKLLSELLNGEVGFNSTEKAGTTFWARYPKKFSKN